MGLQQRLTILTPPTSSCQCASKQKYVVVMTISVSFTISIAFVVEKYFCVKFHLKASLLFSVTICHFHVSDKCYQQAIPFRASDPNVIDCPAEVTWLRTMHSAVIDRRNGDSRVHGKYLCFANLRAAWIIYWISQRQVRDALPRTYTACWSNNYSYNAMDIIICDDGKWVINFLTVPPGNGEAASQNHGHHPDWFSPERSSSPTMIHGIHCMPADTEILQVYIIIYIIQKLLISSPTMLTRNVAGVHWVRDPTCRPSLDPAEAGTSM